VAVERASGGTVVAVHAVGAVPEWSGTNASRRRLDARRKAGHALLDGLDAGGSSASLVKRLVLDEPGDALTATAVAMGSVEVLGGGAGSGRQRSTLESISRRVTDLAPIPFIGVPAAAVHAARRRPSARRVALAVKPGEVTSWLMEGAASLAAATDATVTVVAVDGLAVGARSAVPLDEIARRTEQAARSTAVSLAELGAPVGEIVVLSGTPQPTLLEWLAGSECDLAIVGATHRGSVGERVLGSVPQRLLRHAPVPVAVVPRQTGAGRDQPRVSNVT